MIKIEKAIGKQIRKYLLDIKRDLIDLCEDNDNMKEAIKEYFEELDSCDEDDME